MPSTQKKRSIFSTDGWANLLSGFGVIGRDRRLNTERSTASSVVLGEVAIDDIYRSDGIGTRIIDVVVEDMTREGWRVNGDTDNEISKEFKKFNGYSEFIRGVRTASKHGGAIGVLGLGDGSDDLKNPLNENALQRIGFLRIYDRWRVSWSPMKIYDDPKNANYRMPSEYTISPVNGMSYDVHESRTIRFDGRDVSDLVRVTNQGWGDSDLMPVYDRLRGLGEACGGVETMLADFVTTILSIDNLQALIAQGKESLIRTRLNLLDLSRSIMHTVLLDANEKFDKIQNPVTGIGEVLDKLFLFLSASTGIPVTVLMGQSPAGLNATGASDIRRYYDLVAFRQEERMRAPLERLIRLVMLCKNGPFRGKEIPDWELEFKPLWQPTEGEVVEARRKQAEVDQSYIQNNVLSPEEVRQSRFGGDSYSFETQVEGELAEPDEDDVEEDTEERQ